MTVAKEEKATNLIDQIKEVKKLIKGRSFNTAYEILKGFNRDIDLFDYNYGDFVSTIYRGDNNEPIMSSVFDVYQEMRCCGTFELKEELIDDE